MPTGKLMVARLVHQVRIDEATRTIDVDNGPTLTYQADGARLIRWIVERVVLKWNSGLLYGCNVTGHRIRKDGSVGQIRDYHRFQILNGVIEPPYRRDYPVRWLQAIVNTYGRVMPEDTSDLAGQQAIVREP